MISRILVPMDDSEMAERALRYALESFPDAEITVLHVVGEPSSMMGRAAVLALAEDPEDVAREHARGILDRAREIAAELDAGITTDVKMGHPARAVINTADSFDTVVIGSHGGGIADRLLLGNVAEKIVRRSPVPVTVVR